jgi:ABC-type multidrug transport system ATPase subunit
MYVSREAPLIEVTQLTKCFGPMRAVDGVSFAAGPGEALALIGPNGSGKTTTLKCITGLVAPTGGSVRIGGFHSPAESTACRRLLSYLPQRVAFDESLTCREVLTFYARLRKFSLERVQMLLGEWGLDQVSSRPVHELSGGMVQRLGIAVALLPDAPVLALDEPAGSLDPEGVLMLRRVLQEWKAAGRTIILASHSLADVEAAADRVAIFLSGRIAAMEPLEIFRRGLRSASLEEVYLRYVHSTADLAGARDSAERVRARPARAR